MRRILPFVVIGILILSGFGAVAINNDEDKLEYEQIEERTIGDRGIEYSHTILGEFGTATWCPYCVYGDEALGNIYTGQWHPFYYIALVCDVNTNAYQRAINELGLGGYPTVYFDGGYKSNVGASSVPSAQAAYNSSIEDCAEREVADVDIDLDVTWNGNAEMYIEVNVDNNEGSTYSGHLHVYVTELVTSMGWNNNDGIPYKFPFLDYAFNEDISVSAGGTWTDSITWDGHDYDNGYGDDFSSISYGNIMVIGAVFDEDNDDYADDTTGYRVGDNDPPSTPSGPEPSDGDTDVDTDADISWSCTDPDYDVLSYDIYFGESSNPPLEASDIVGRTYDPGPLDLDTTYYWKIVAKDEMGGTTTGPIWDFTTRGNDPPNSPSDPNPYDGDTGVYINTDVSWTCSDPDGDDITYDVYFGTSNPPPKVVNNQTETSYNPPDNLDFNTLYYWQIVAWDEYKYSTLGTIWSFTTEENLPPNTPSDPDPEDGATDVDINILLKWTGGDPNPGDSVKYDIYFGASNPPPLEAEDLMQAAYDPGTMILDTTYYWKIVSKDNQGLTTEGPIWSFTTESEPTYPPEAPDIDGPLTGDPGTEYNYIFNSVDPDGHNVKYYVDWGDGNTDETGFNPEGADVTIPHTYTASGKYTITAYAEDETGKTSPTSTFITTMPRAKTVTFFLQKILGQFTYAFPILRQLLGL
jgi:hypothetical protein